VQTAKRAPSSAAVFRAVADPTRRAILDMLLTGEHTVGEIAERFAVSRPAVSKHLRVLRDARLIRARREGRRRLCALEPEPLRVVDEWLTGYRREWQSRLARLKRHVEVESRPRAAETQEPRAERAESIPRMRGGSP
jgi:DNA-binding transcriptional ArsR family regulator